MSNNSVKTLELVVSAIHCLREKRGSSPQNILRYLSGKYNVDTEMLKPYIKTGLKRGVSFGLITHQSGLYRLNDILSPPSDQPTSNKEKPHRSKFYKAGGLLKRGQTAGRKRRRLFRPATSLLQKNKRKLKKCRDRRKKTGLTSRRHHNDKRRKQRRQKSRGKKRMRRKGDKPKKVKKLDSQLTKPEESEKQNIEKEVEHTKDISKM